MIRVLLSELVESSEKILKRLEYPDTQRPILLEVLSYAFLRNNFQFIIQACVKGIPAHHAKGEPVAVHETPLSCRLDGRDNYGIVVMERSMSIAIEKARKSGFGIVASFNSAPPGTGPLGYYAEQIAREGFIGFAFSGSSKKVALEGARHPVFGSNPIAVGLPQGNKPLVLDFASSAVPVFKVVEASLLGKPLPQTGFDAEGRPTNDPTAILKGVIGPFGGFKGSSLGLIVEALTGPLSGASWVGQNDVATNWGNLVYAIDPNLLMPRSEFEERMTEWRAALHANGSPVLPGERGQQLMEVNRKRGFIELDETIYTIYQKTL